MGNTISYTLENLDEEEDKEKLEEMVEHHILHIGVEHYGCCILIPSSPNNISNYFQGRP